MKLSEIMTKDEWSYIVEKCFPAKVKPELIAAIGWHETHWGRLGMGRYGYHLGVSCWERNELQFNSAKAQGFIDWETYSKTKKGHLFCSIHYRGYKKQVDWAVNLIKELVPLNFDFDDLKRLNRAWIPSDKAYNWARGVWRVYTELEDDLRPVNREAREDEVLAAEGELPSNAGILQRIAHYLEEIAKLLKEWRL